MAAGRFHRLRRTEMLREITDRGEMFAVAVAPPRERARARDRLPEKFRGGAILRLAGDLIQPLEADDLRNLSVLMKPVERIAAFGQRRENRPVAEALSESEVPLVFREHVNVSEHFIH